MSLTELLNGATDAAEAIHKVAVTDGNRSLTDDERTAFDVHMADARKYKTLLDSQNELADLRAAARVETPAPGPAPAAVVEDRKADDVEQEARAAAPVVKEKPLYGPQGVGQRSWVGDLLAWKVTGDSEARTRLGSVDAENRAYSAATTTEGGYLVAPAYLQSMFQKFLNAGTPTLGIINNMLHPGTRTVYIPKQDGGTAVARFAENATLTETSATFAQVTATSYRAGGLATLSGELTDFSDPSIEGIVASDLMEHLAVLVCGWVLNGSNSNQPQGIYGTSGIGSVTYTAGTATAAGLFSAIVKAVQTVNSAYFGEVSHVVMDPRRWAWLIAQADTAGRPVAGALAPQNALAAGTSTLQGVEGRSILGVPVVLDSNIPKTLGAGTDEDTILVGDFSKAYRWSGPVAMDADRSVGFKLDQLTLRVKQDNIFSAAPRPEAFCRIIGTGLNDTL